MNTVEDKLSKMVECREKLARKLSFFDASIWLGRPVGFPLAEELKLPNIDAALSKAFIDGGLVSHWRGKAVSPQDGNNTLEAASDQLSDNAYSIWTGLPLYPTDPGPLPGMGKLPEKLRGVRLFPVTHNFPFADWAIGSLCEWMIEKNLSRFVLHTYIN